MKWMAAIHASRIGLWRTKPRATEGDYMTPNPVSLQNPAANDEAKIRHIYEQLLDRWNKRDAHGFAGLFSEDANVIGFDGSQYNGRSEIETEISGVFKDHVTATYVAKVREVRFASSQAAILRAVTGMIPPGQSDINPAVNAIQTLLAVKSAGGWQIALFQNTPAQFHGRPDAAAQLTAELRELL
jgi:uncharacterized protein (TIGR02246 family)